MTDLPGTQVPFTHPLTHYKLLSFDVFGTLIDWETGIYNAIKSSTPFMALPKDSQIHANREALLTQYKIHERRLQIEQPTMEYGQLIGEAFKSVCADNELSVGSEELDEAAKVFGESFKDWPVFDDTLDALRRLHERYPYLVPLTNSSHATYGATHRSEKGFNNYPFDAVYLAEDIGTYKPSLNNFHYLLKHAEKDFGVKKDEILHVAQSLHHDHVPATKLGISRVWVDRGGVMGAAVGEEEVSWNLRVKSMKELADYVDEAFVKERK